MIVGSAKSSTRGVTAMAETKRMTTEQVVGYLLEGEGIGGAGSRSGSSPRPCSSAGSFGGYEDVGPGRPTADRRPL
jgi:hypothetical protein